MWSSVQSIIFTKQEILGDDLKELEAELVLSVATPDPLLSEVAGHLISAGGKRIRPILAITSARAGGAEVDRRVVQGAVAVELVHLASLYHDDVMDEATERRGVPSVNARWGNLVAVVSGDFLLARAAGIAARLGSDIAELLADTLAEMCEGQIIEVKSGFDTDRTEAQYLQAISGKTASLLATSARIGAMAGGVEQAKVEMLTDIGRNFGMLFQLRDDILDVAASQADLGKLPGQDLIEGVYNLPVIYALAGSEPAGELRSLLADRITPSTLPTATELIIRSGALSACFDVAAFYQRRIEKLAAELTDPYSSYIADLGRQLLGSLDDLVARTVA